jgi:hypothetical protein
LVCATAPPAPSSDVETKEESKQSGVDTMCVFVASAKPKSVDILVLAPPIDLNRHILARLSPENVRGIWAWGGLPKESNSPPPPLLSPPPPPPSGNSISLPVSSDVKAESLYAAAFVDYDSKSATSVLKSGPVTQREQKPVVATSRGVISVPRRIRVSDTSAKSASFNWRSAPTETADLLEWSQTHHIPYTIATPSVYVTTAAWAGFVGVTEANNPRFAELLREKPELALIGTWIKQWNDTCPEAVKIRCNILPGSLQFTPADPVAVAVYLWSESIIASQESVRLVGESGRDPAESDDSKDDAENVTALGDPTITFVNAIHYAFFIDRLCEL